jgi:hypothetical protein
MKEISETIICANDLEETTRPLLERLQKEVFKRKVRMATRLGAIMNELVEIQDSNNENKESVGVVHKFIEVTIEVGETTKITQKEV